MSLSDGGRAPQGARGLKCAKWAFPESSTKSRPARGAWIEMSMMHCTSVRKLVAPRKGRVD